MKIRKEETQINNISIKEGLINSNCNNNAKAKIKEKDK
jgi:hypothetical protein